MENSQKGFVSTVLIIVLVVVVSAVGYVAMTQQESSQVPISDSVPVSLSLGDPLSGSMVRQLNPENPSTNTSEAIPASTPSATPIPSTTQSTLIDVPVRVHLLQSAYSQVQTTVTPDEVRTMFDGPDGANKRYWNQYGINLKIESIVKDSAVNDSGFAQSIAAGSKPSLQQFAQLIPAQNKLFSLDFVVVHDFGANGGGLTQPKKGIMFVPESSIKGSGSKIMTFGFAHEFGHILLGAPHFSNSIDPYNIMAVGDPTVYDPFNKTHLTQDQITTAQAQAKKGTPNLTRAGQ